MADAIPTPADKQPSTKSTVLLPAPTSRWTALKEAGWWAGMDTTFCIALAFIWVTALYWKIFGHPNLLNIVVLLLISLIILVAWLIILVYRCSLFVLQLHADIALMPDTAARMAVAYLSGKTPSSPPKAS
jgi:hypothetical protein